MAYIEVDVDLDQFELSEIAEYLMRKKNSKRESDRLKVLDLLKELRQVHVGANHKNLSKVDEWKDELWPTIKEKLTLEQLEALC